LHAAAYYVQFHTLRQQALAEQSTAGHAPAGPAARAPRR
jgi:hypothetical protein